MDGYPVNQALECWRLSTEYFRGLRRSLAGGMEVVCRARGARMDRDVAIKTSPCAVGQGLGCFALPRLPCNGPAITQQSCETLGNDLPILVI